MTTTQLLTKCKACKRDVVASADSACPEAWVKQLLPMVTCNYCFDLKLQKDKAVALIQAGCVQLFQASSRTTELVTKVRETLTAGTKLYGRFLAEFYKAKTSVWSVEFVDMLIENPGRWQLILSHYRTNFRKEYCQPTPKPLQLAEL